MSLASPIRVYLLDDHEIVRQGLRALLSAVPDLAAIAQGIVSALRRRSPVGG